MPTLNWIGKDKVVTHHNDVPFRVLDRKYTFGDAPDSGNKIIHGDNLEALKALLSTLIHLTTPATKVGCIMTM